MLGSLLKHVGYVMQLQQKVLSKMSTHWLVHGQTNDAHWQKADHCHIQACQKRIPLNPHLSFKF